jgi:transposase-like protein
MEVRKSLNGKRLWTAEQKREILSELEQGFTPAEIARRYEIQLQYLYRWRRRFQDGGEVALKSDEAVVPVSEIKRLEVEKKALQRALGEMTMERNILRDAVAVAREKKWILGGG